MIIENPEALKGWLTSCLEPMCDADPAALAKYVMALVKKDKSEKELKEICLDQLEVFLQKSTCSFVGLLFQTLSSKSYLKPTPAPPVDAVNTVNGTLINKVAPVTQPAGPIMTAVVPTVLSPTTVVNSSKNDSKRPKTTPESDDARRRSKSRSRSPVGRVSYSTRSLSKEKDERRNRRYDDDRRRRPNQGGRRYDNRYRDFRDRKDVHDRDRQVRDRDTRSNREKPSNEHDRSKSRSRSRSWSPKSWSRSRSRSRSRSWSRPRDRPDRPGRDSMRSSDSRSNQSSTHAPEQHKLDHGDTDYRINSHAGPPLPPGPPPVPNEQQQFRSGKAAKRCRDYDEKGYCMRGDLCPYDHGNDPVVVEDVSVLGFGNNSTPVTQPPGGAPPSANTSAPLPPPSSLPMLPTMMSQPPQQPPQPPMRPPLPQPPPPPEPYNPEAPGMDRPSRMHPGFWGPPMPHVRPPPGPPRGPPPPFHSGPPPRARELIGVPTVDNSGQMGANGNKSVLNQRMVLEPHQQANNQQPLINEHPFKPGEFRRRMFDYNRLGPKKGPYNNSGDRCTLELRKVPRQLNNIAELNGHFSKFGTIVNLQVSFGGDPEAALVQFSSHGEANAAYRSTEAVLNNRFVKVFWHNKEGSNNPPQPLQKTGEALPNPVAAADSNNVTNPKTNVKERLGLSNVVRRNAPLTPVNLEESTERAVIYSTGGNLTRTVFSPSALKKTNNVFSKKVKEEQKKDLLKRKIEVQKKRQEIIQQKVQQQKLLFDKLDKCKSEKEKLAIKETLFGLSKGIEEVQSDIKTMATEISSLSSAMGHKPTKTEAEKELLDAEMDLYNKQHTGDDTTELRNKVNELKQQARALGLLDSPAVPNRRRGPMVKRNLQNYRGLRPSRKLDRRPRKILVEGLLESERENLIVHFSQLGEVENVDQVKNCTLVTFKTRREAEKAVQLGSLFKEKKLKMSWYKESQPLSADIASLDADTVEGEIHLNDENQEHLATDEDLLLGDDEEEEDSEARSWRR